MRKYPSRLRALRLKDLLESLWIETNHHLVANDDCRSRTALILAHQFPYGGIVTGDIADFEIDSSLREEGLSNLARRSTWLTKHDYFVLLHVYWILTILEQSLENRKRRKRSAGLITCDYPSAARYGSVP